ncbi:ZIP family metal transporter [Rhodococcus opacus]|uniref:Metal transporter n=1 Tax=Rhodococcus opacus TaxID=37919 RepID=A0A076EZ16_RHOOP|nr:ZIP family metal transporter [Rhodococcus opacus]AII11220.1 metal transporter [Rhodococcus opacus]
MDSRTTRNRAWMSAVGATLLLGAALLLLALVGGKTLPERAGPPIEQLAVERTELVPGYIDVTVRNTGPDPVQVAQVFVNDAYVDLTGGEQPIPRLGTAMLRLDYPWQEGQPYLLSLLTSTGLVIEHEIPVAATTPQADAGFFSLMALIGTYVGIIPVVLGMMFLPVLRRIGSRGIRVLLGLTVGLLAFLAIDATIEGVEVSESGGGAFGGPALVVLGAVLAFLALTALDRYLGSRRTVNDAQGSSGIRLAVMIAIGIGLHNLGEGLAIGAAYAVGELALGTALVVGFTIQNTTEGLAVVAPLTERRPPLLQLLGLGLLAGAPAILGALIGASVNNAELSAFLLGIGVGAIAQVIIQIAPSLRDGAGRFLSPATIGGIAAGLLTMYVTGLLVTA